MYSTCIYKIRDCLVCVSDRSVCRSRVGPAAASEQTNQETISPADRTAWTRGFYQLYISPAESTGYIWKSSRASWKESASMARSSPR